MIRRSQSIETRIRWDPVPGSATASSSPGVRKNSIVLVAASPKRHASAYHGAQPRRPTGVTRVVSSSRSISRRSDPTGSTGLSQEIVTRWCGPL